MRRRHRDVLVLCYHGIAPASVHGEVEPGAFRAQLEHVASRGYRWTTFSEAVLGPEEDRVAAVTFDDGIGTALENGLPILEELGAPGTMFVRLDAFAWEDWIKPEDLPRLVERGWEIGSHTSTHPVLTDVDDVTLRDELVGSREELERLTGKPCTAVAYPTGRVDARVMAAAVAAGYTAGAALEGAIDGKLGPLAWPRVGIRGDDSLQVFRLKCSRPVRGLRSSWLRRPTARIASSAGRTRRRLA